MSGAGSPKLLVVFATTHGHTAKVAARIAEAAQAQGAEVDLRELGKDEAPHGGSHDAVIAGGSLHAGQHQHALADWVSANKAALGERPSAFFSVSLTAADDTEEALEATQGCIDEFLEQTGWNPETTASIAGCLQYREYDVFTRTLMRLKMRGGGHPTDTSQDHEFTDWIAVERFGRECAELAVRDDARR